MTMWLLALLLWQTPVRDTPSRAGARISGVVVGAIDRAPVRHALVSLSGLSSETMITGDDGAFSFPELPAGRYQLAVSKPGFATSRYGTRPGRDLSTAIVLAVGQQLTSLQLVLSRGAVISGTATGGNGEPIVGANVAALAVSGIAENRTPILIPVATGRTKEDGSYRLFGLPEGDFVVSVSPIERPDEVRYGPTHYPGVSDLGDATPISVNAGEERSGADVVLRASAVATVRGFVTGTDGQPASGQLVALRPAVGKVATPFPMWPDDLSVRSNSDGSFTFPAVLAGRYVAFAEANPPTSLRRATETPTWARAEVVVDGIDVSGVSLVLHPETPISGRVVVEGNRAAETPAMEVTIADQQGGAWPTSRTVTSAGDGTWSVSGVPPGSYSVRAETPESPSDTWRLVMRSATLAGRDVMNDRLDVGTEPIKDVVVTFTDQVGGVRGAIVDAAGAPAPDFIIVVFLADAAQRALHPSDIRIVAPDSNGAWSVSRLWPGEYRVAALSDWNSRSRITASLFEQLAAASAPVTVTAGTLAPLTLRIGK